MRTSTNSILLIIGATLGFSVGYVIRGAQETVSNEVRQPVVQELEKTIEETYTVSRVVDGDTIYINEGVEVLLSKIRLLGMDTPERGKPLYKEAKEKLEDLITGRSISLERDKDNIDRYGRALRYIIVDNQNINIEMVRLGYARAFMHEGLRYENEILAAQKEARENKRGIWINR